MRYTDRRRTSQVLSYNQESDSVAIENALHLSDSLAEAQGHPLASSGATNRGITCRLLLMGDGEAKAKEQWKI
jgi:hypothetical protein